MASNTDCARDVLRALATYNGNGYCPVCDATVIDGYASTDGLGHEITWPAYGGLPTHTICTACAWAQPIAMAFDWGLINKFIQDDADRAEARVQALIAGW